MRFMMQQAVFEAVSEINDQSNDQPDYKSYPGDAGQPRHQKYTASYAHKRDDRIKGDFKSAVP